MAHKEGLMCPDCSENKSHRQNKRSNAGKLEYCGVGWGGVGGSGWCYELVVGVMT